MHFNKGMFSALLAAGLAGIALSMPISSSQVAFTGLFALLTIFSVALFGFTRVRSIRSPRIPQEECDLIPTLWQPLLLAITAVLWILVFFHAQEKFRYIALLLPFLISKLTRFSDRGDPLNTALDISSLELGFDCIDMLNILQIDAKENLDWKAIGSASIWAVSILSRSALFFSSHTSCFWKALDKSNLMLGADVFLHPRDTRDQSPVIRREVWFEMERRGVVREWFAVKTRVLVLWLQLPGETAALLLRLLLLFSGHSRWCALMLLKNVVGLWRILSGTATWLSAQVKADKVEEDGPAKPEPPQPRPKARVWLALSSFLLVLIAGYLFCVVATVHEPIVWAIVLILDVLAIPVATLVVANRLFGRRLSLAPNILWGEEARGNPGALLLLLGASGLLIMCSKLPIICFVMSKLRTRQGVFSIQVLDMVTRSVFLYMLCVGRAVGALFAREQQQMGDYIPLEDDPSAPKRRIAAIVGAAPLAGSAARATLSEGVMDLLSAAVLFQMDAESSTVLLKLILAGCFFLELLNSISPVLFPPVVLHARSDASMLLYLSGRWRFQRLVLDSAVIVLRTARCLIADAAPSVFLLKNIMQLLHSMSLIWRIREVSDTGNPYFSSFGSLEPPQE